MPTSRDREQAREIAHGHECGCIDVGHGHVPACNRLTREIATALEQARAEEREAVADFLDKRADMLAEDEDRRTMRHARDLIRARSREDR